MQGAGRAGRHAKGGEVIIQTDYPEQSVYQAMSRHDYAGFARYSLDEREAIGLPPYAYQALLTAEARELRVALDFLAQASALPHDCPSDYPGAGAVTLYDSSHARRVGQECVSQCNSRWSPYN